MFASAAENGQLLHERLQCTACSRLGGEVVAVAAEPVLVGNNECGGGGRLVVVEHHLLDGGTKLHDGLLNAFRTVFFAVGRDEQTLEASLHIKELFGRHVSQVAGVEPSVADGFGRGFRVFPISGHYILATDDDFALLTQGDCLTVGIADAHFHAFQHTSRGAEAVIVRRVGGDDGSGLGKAVTLEHGEADADEEVLEVLVEECAASDKEA